jgi:predicted nucleic-acid-binding Zn-ribbon protein
MKNGQCPKCGSREIYASLGGGGIGDGFSIHVREGDSMKPTRSWQTLLCASCGYYENYLLDEVRIARIVDDPQKAGWKKLSE